jgi:hypothetical protein
MSRLRRFAACQGLVAIAAFALASIDFPLTAQIGGSGAGQLPRGSQPPGTGSSVKLKEPTSLRVYQRDANGKADIPIVLDESQQDAELVSAHITDSRLAGFQIQQDDGTRVGANRVDGNLVDGKLAGIPVGGPYTITCQVKANGKTANVTINNVYVGDLWVLAGQSNMEGVGELIDVTSPYPGVMLLGMDGRWRQAEEPLHWLVDSPDPVHSGDAKTRTARSAQAHKTRKK